MEAAQIKKFWKAFKFHTKIAWRGFYRTVYGALVAWLVAMAIYGFASVTKETGWVAVWDFVASCATLIVAMCNVYRIGCNKKGAKCG